VTVVGGAAVTVVGGEGSSEAEKAVITNCKCCLKPEASDAKLCNGNDACNCKDPSAMSKCCSRCVDSIVQKSTNCNGCLKNGEDVPGARVSLFSAIKAAEKLESLKRSSGLQPVTIRTLDSDISAVVDGENAMFPDKLFREESSETGNDENLKADGENSEKNPSDMETELDSPFSKHKETAAEDEISSRLSESSSQSYVERFVRDVMSRGWQVGGDEKLTVAELYLMLGKGGEVRLEYEWVTVKSEAEIARERLLQNRNNMLRRLSHLATVEFTDFTKVNMCEIICEKVPYGGTNIVCPNQTLHIMHVV